MLHSNGYNEILKTKAVDLVRLWPKQQNSAYFFDFATKILLLLHKNDREIPGHRFFSGKNRMHRLELAQTVISY
jgi:hypothetical protein